MRTVFSERYAGRLLGTLTKVEFEEDAHPRDPGGRFAPKGEASSKVSGEVFVAALRGFSTGNFAELRRLHGDQEMVQRLDRNIGEQGSSFRLGSGMPTKVQEKLKAAGAWYEEKEGRKIPTMEPAFAVTVAGDEDDILREAAGLGKDFDQAAVLVAVYDPAGEGAMFHLDLDSSKVDDRVRGAVVQHFLDAGLGGATSILDQPSFRFAALSSADADVIEKATKKLPDEYKPKLTRIPARVRFIGSDEYDGLLGKKVAAVSDVRAEVIIGGIRKR